MCRYVHAAALGCIPVFFVHSDQCARGIPLAETPGESIADCSVFVYQRDVPELHNRLAAISSAKRDEMRVCSKTSPAFCY